MSITTLTKESPWKEEALQEDQFKSRFAGIKIKQPKPKKSCCGRPVKQDESKMVPTIPLSSLLGRLEGEYKALMVFGTIFGLLQGAALPSFAVLMGVLFAEFNPNSSVDSILSQAGLIAGLFIALGVFNWVMGSLSAWMWSKVGDRMSLVLREEFFAAVLRQEVGFFDSNMSGKLSNILDKDIEAIRNATSSKVAQLASAMGQAIAGVIIALVYAWQLALVLIAISPLMMIGAGLQQMFIASGAQSQAGKFGVASSFATEVIKGIRTVAAYNYEDESGRKYTDQLGDARDTKGLLVSAFFFGLSFFLIFGMYSVGLYVGALFMTRAYFGPGDFLTAFFSVLVGALALGQAAPLFPDFAKGRGAAVEVVKLLERKPLVSVNPDGVSSGPFIPSVEFDKVRFTFPNREREVLSGISFVAKPGQSIGLVGQSGAGKSTLVKLLERFYDCTEGQILVGGRNLADYNLHWLRTKIGIVSQEPTLFNTTIKDNILIGKPGATDDEIMAAAVAANAHDFIMSFPEQYDTMVGEGGGQMSGGQRQRICIARAILKDPPILILDEATASLDNQSEAVVQEALERASAGRTTFAIAHRLSTIKNSDLIVVMDQGEVAESGKHWDLMMQRGLYYALQVRQMLPEELRDLEHQMAERKRAQAAEAESKELNAEEHNNNNAA